jgi:hypothetical protein
VEFYAKLMNLSKKCWNWYNDLLSNSVVKNAFKTADMPQAMPILFFGDYEKYFASPIRIITVAINPSKKEFPTEDSFQRFPAMYGVNYKESPEFYENYLNTLKDYFNFSPYMKWFKHYNHVLSGINSSFLESYENTALHTDLYSPFPTDPVWSGLNREQKQLLIDKGIQLWNELVDILQPDIILMSTAESMTNNLGFEFLSEWEVIHSFPEKANGEAMAKPYLLKRRKLKLSNQKEVQLFWGAAGVTPFQYLSNPKKREAGEMILASYYENPQKTFVQFMHPGGEHKPNSSGEISPWNTNDHKRKFMKNPGEYVTGLDGRDPERAELTFWGEWEAQAKVLERLDGSKGPKYLYKPFYEKPTNYTGKQNTDPFIFGDHFYYTCCRQYKRTSNGKLTPTKLTRLQFGSVILFGSCIGNQFALDTVFVVGNTPIIHNKDTIDEVAEGVPDTYKDVTLAPLYPEHFSEADAIGPVDTSKSCLVSDSNGENEEDDGEEINETDNLNFYLYKGITYENRHFANGMFSFFPCLPYTGENIGFIRPIINLEDVISPKLAMGFKTTSYDDPENVKKLWESVVKQVIEQGLALGVQTDMPVKTGDLEIDEEPPILGNGDVITRINPAAFKKAYNSFNNLVDITDTYESHEFYKGNRENWFAPLSFKNSIIPVFNPPSINRTQPWKSCYAFSYFFMINRDKNRLVLKLELGPYTPENGSRHQLLNFLHEQDKSRENRFSITPFALNNPDAQFSRLSKAEIDINNWDNEGEILEKMNKLLEMIDFNHLSNYVIQLYGEFKRH